MINQIAQHPKLTVWVIIVVSLMLSTLLVGRAQAAEYKWVWEVQSGSNGYQVKRRVKKVRRVAYKKKADTHEATRVMAYSKRQQLSCLSRVRAVGSQWVGASGAKQSAIKAWREIVRFDSGEKFSDWANATEVMQGCSRSSISEVIGKVLYRCEVSAAPCKMKLTGDGR
ncbi:MAG: hypothetical protein GY877_03165 [Hyphomicrobium sp.]|nr:hypothetical protein [Hyphomicrobium sp.]